MRANDSAQPRIATGTEVFHLEKTWQLQSGHKLSAALNELAFEDWRFVDRFGDTTSRMDEPSILEGLPTAHRKKEFFCEFHKSIPSQQ